MSSSCWGQTMGLPLRRRFAIFPPLSSVSKALSRTPTYSLTSTFDVDLPIPRQSMATYLTDGYPVVARNTGCAYWNMHDWFGPFDASRMLDACHCNDAGGRAIAEEMLKQLRALG